MGPSVDRTTFDRLVLDHLPAAHRFAIRLTGDTDAAEEVVQDALLRASRGWRTFRGESAFRTWLFQVVVNSFRDHRSASAIAAGRGGGDGLPDELPDRRPDARPPLERASAAEQGERVARLVSSLPPRQREVLVLHAYEGLPPAEIAAVLGLSDSNVRANLSFARQRMRELLADLIEGERHERSSTPGTDVR